MCHINILNTINMLCPHQHASINILNTIYTLCFHQHIKHYLHVGSPINMLNTIYIQDLHQHVKLILSTCFAPIKHYIHINMLCVHQCVINMFRHGIFPFLTGIPVFNLRRDHFFCLFFSQNMMIFWLFFLGSIPCLLMLDSYLPH